MSSHDQHAPDPSAQQAPERGTDRAARRVTVHSGRVRPSSPITVTPSLATHMVANPPSDGDTEPALHFDLPTAPVVDRSGHSPSDVPSGHGPVADGDDLGDGHLGDGHAGDDHDGDPAAGHAVDTPRPRRWWHRLLFWRRSPTRTASAGSRQTGCRLCSWDGDGPCPLGHSG